MNHVCVTIIGSGTCVPSLTRSSCSVLIEYGTWKFLFDIGPGTVRQLLKAGIHISQISHLCLSHFHPDHTSELPSLLFASKYPDTYKRRRHLTIIGSLGTRSFYHAFCSVYGHWIELEEGMLEIKEMDNRKSDVFLFSEGKVLTMPMDHIASSLGYRFEAQDGTSVVYTGDTDYCDNVIKLARNADILVCESALPDEKKIKGHLTPSLAGRIATSAQVKHLVLTHFYPECDSVNIETECRRTYAGSLKVAHDLYNIKIGPNSNNLN